MLWGELLNFGPKYAKENSFRTQLLYRFVGFQILRLIPKAWKAKMPKNLKNHTLMEVRIVNHSHHALPAYATEQSAGMDLRANLDSPVVLRPLERRLIPTGLFISLPAGYEAQVRPRSGLALKKGISVLNTPGTIDADYRGEIGVILVNLSNEDFTVEDGERIAQMVVARHEQVSWKPVESLDETERGAGGFGHTGRE